MIELTSRTYAAPWTDEDIAIRYGRGHSIPETIFMCLATDVDKRDADLFLALVSASQETKDAAAR